MKHKAFKIFLNIIALASVFGLNTSFIFAQNTTSDSKVITTIKSRGDKELTRRIDILTNISSRIQEMKNVPDNTKTILKTQLQNQINALTDLRMQINAEASITMLKTEVKSMTDSYNIFSLVISQGRIYVVIDRLTTLLNYMSGIGAKLQVRVNVGELDPSEKVSITATFSDYSAKLIDAQSKIQEAFNGISNLIPDQNDKTVMQSNIVKLKDARSKIKIAEQDIIDVSKYIIAIRNGLLKESKIGINATTTVSQ